MINTKMKAIVKEHTGRDGLRMQEVPVPVCGLNDVLIKVSYAGICGTDLHIQNDEYPVYMPVIIGHEFSGTVAAFGSAVTGFEIGERVVSMTCSESCGKCDYCRQGLPMFCPDKRGLGSGHDGAFAEYMCTKAELVLPIPDNMSMQEAALSEPFASVVRAVTENARITLGDKVFVSGVGMMGQLTAQLCTAAGADVTIAGLASDAERFALIHRLCPSVHILNLGMDDLVETALELTGGDLYDVVFECTGIPASGVNTIEVCRRKGQLIQLGLYGKSVPVDLDKALFRELRIIPTFSAAYSTWKRMFKILAMKKADLRPYIGERIYDFEDWEAAFERARSKQDYKVLMRVAEEA